MKVELLTALQICKDLKRASRLTHDSSKKILGMIELAELGDANWRDIVDHAVWTEANAAETARVAALARKSVERAAAKYAL